MAGWHPFAKPPRPRDLDHRALTDGMCRMILLVTGMPEPVSMTDTGSSSDRLPAF
jgi:hypothetical protein